MSSVEVAQRFFEEFPAYSEYKDSGIDWLGEIPKHWEVKRLFFLAKRIGDGIHSTPQYVDVSEYYFINGNNLTNGNIIINESTKYVSQDEFEKYDLCLNKRTLLLSINGTIGNLAFYQNEKVILGKSASYIELKPSIEMKFAYYFFSSINAKNYFFYEVTGSTIFNLSLKSIKNIFLSVPSINEQKQIASFLDRATTEIDQIIEQQKQLITLLEEERTTVISHAVTKGLDPSVPMKDSGIAWLGEIPKHWDVKKLKHVAEINTDTLPENTDSTYLLNYLDIGNVNTKGEIIEVQELIFKDAPSRARRVVNAGDTAISTVRTYLRAIVFIDQPPDNLIVSTGFAVLRPTVELYPKFLFRLIQSQQFIDTVVALSTGVSYPAITPYQLASLAVWLPTFQEQQAITSFVDQETARIDEAIENVRSQIEKLEEYRTVLISDAVTGKIDVRGFS